MILRLPKSCLVLALYVTLGFLTYANSLHSPFMMDDHIFFDNTKKSAHVLRDQFLPDKTAVLGSRGVQDNAYYRPLAHVQLVIFYWLFHGHPVGYHAINVVLFALAAFCWYRFLGAVFKEEGLAFWTALFYLMHPINGIVVNYITASVFSTEVMLMILSAHFFWRSLERGWADCKVTRTQGHKDTISPSFLQFTIYHIPLALSLWFFALSLLYHETTLFLPLYLMMVLLIVRGIPLIASIRALVPFAVVGAGYLLFRFFYTPLVSNFIQQTSSHQAGILTVLGSFAKLMLWYVSQLVSPSGVLFMYTIEPVTQGAVIWVAALLAVVAGGIWLWRACRELAPVRFGLAVLGLGFLPLAAASVFKAHGFMLEPHWFVFPSIGFFVALAALLRRCPRKIFLSGAVGLLVVWFFVGRVYNDLWSSEQRYCLYWLSETPAFNTPKFYLARTYLQQHDFTNARRYYKAALTGGYADSLIYANLGLMDLNEGKWAEGRNHFLKALTIEPRSSGALNGLGVIAAQQNQPEAAIKYFSAAVAAEPYATAGRLNLARLLARHYRLTEAAAVYQGLLKMVPGDEAALLGLLQIAVQSRDRAQTLALCEKLQRVTRRPAVLVQLARLYQQMGEEEAARVLINRARQLTAH